MCGNKMRFRDYEEAVEALHHASVARHRCEVDGVTTTHREVRAYPCPRCRGYHLTSKA